MMDEIFNFPRTWKYGMPFVVVVLLFPVTGKMVASPNPEIRFWAMVPFGLMIVFTIIGLVNLWKYMSAHATEMFERRQTALSTTPLVLLSENMKQMHPEAVRVLNRFGVRASWQVSVTNAGDRDWVLADTNAHFGFIEFVLSRSGKALYPKNRFSQGSKKWDPDGLVEDREQYDDLERWLFSRLMVTRSHGEYQPAEFIPPWNPELILETLGLSGEQDLYKPESTLKQLGKEPVATNGSGNGNGNGHKAASAEVPDLTEEQLEAITKEQMAYSQNLKGDSQ
jgi:hypothetical protein